MKCHRPKLSSLSTRHRGRIIPCDFAGPCVHVYSKELQFLIKRGRHRRLKNADTASLSISGLRSFYKTCPDIKNSHLGSVGFSRSHTRNRTSIRCFSKVQYLFKIRYFRSCVNRKYMENNGYIIFFVAKKKVTRAAERYPRHVYGNK